MAPARRPTPPPEDEAAQCFTRFPPDPASLSDPDGRHRRGKPRIPVEQSWARQSHVLDWRGTLVEVSPEHGRPGHGPEEPAYFLTAADPYGKPSTLRQNLERTDRLLRAIPGVLPSVGVAPDRTWFEPEVLITPGVSEEDALDLAVGLGQPAVVRWRADELTVLPTRLGVEVATSTVPALVSPWSGSCPIRVDDDPTGVCRRRGGPYGSAAIHAAALAQHHREVAVSLLGCQVCEGRALGPGSAITLSPILVSSRYGGATWRR